jgi:ABC-2 type transport system ATP-binding protein
MMTTPAISISQLSKTYGGRFGRTVRALDSIDLQVGRGEMFGLLGPNGAGKTTTVKILLDLTRPTSGSAQILGLPVSSPASRRSVGYLPEGHRFPGYLTARETLSIFGRLSGLDSATANRRMVPLLERLRIAEWIDVRVRKFSKGMTQRLGLATALLHDPEVLLLDEPTDGVDPVGRREIRDLLREEVAAGKTVLVNSHLLSEIELTCDRVAVLRGGRVVASGTVAELTVSKWQYKMIAAGPGDVINQALQESGVGVMRQNGHFLLRVENAEQLNAAIDQVRKAGGLLSELAPVRSSLEDVFVDLVRTGEAPQEALR